MTTARLLLSALTFLAGTSIAFAFPRPSYSGAEVVQRAEIIVVARLKPDSIRLIMDPAREGEAQGWHNEAVLIVREVLKGECRERELPIVIHYGLTPIVERHIRDERMGFDDRPADGKLPQGIIEIYDHANSFRRVSSDIREDHIWLLRHSLPGFRPQGRTDLPGIWDPEDVQSVERRDELRQYWHADDA